MVPCIEMQSSPLDEYGQLSTRLLNVGKTQDIKIVFL